MQFKENEPLAPYTTLKIGGQARYFTVVENVDELKQALEFAKGKNLETWVFGGGSNVVVNDDGFNGLAIQINNKGKKVFAEYDHQLELEIAAGEVWDEVVQMAVAENLWGIENLSHIPGRSGALAMQNVGAYGQEASQVVQRVISLDTVSLELVDHSAEDCQFSYRRSIFNSFYKGRYAILYVTLKLSKLPKPNLSYRDLKQKFGETDVNITDIRKAVIEIRNKKFPFPVEAKNGNVGSFFKNVVLNETEFAKLVAKFEKEFGKEKTEELKTKVFASASSNEVKVPAAFLLDVCGLKDLSLGGAAINHNQPLVIVNATGKATAKDILGLAEQVKEVVKGKTGLVIEQEPELVGF